ncbi:MAG: FAD-binding oxidoreductase [Burkholderiaceae bacterium]
MTSARHSRRHILKAATAAGLSARWPAGLTATPEPSLSAPLARVRPGDAAWPSETRWAQLRQQVGGALLKLRSPFAGCMAAPSSETCTRLFKSIQNPYFIGESAGLTQALGWVDAWTSMPSAYAVAARNAADVVAAVNFARESRLRLVVKGGGHSYQGTSSAPDSLLIWTHGMNDIALHDAFVGQGCAAPAAPQRAVTVGAGALWANAYDAVTTKGGGYVQGGGCTTVGVAGLVQCGGFGSFSKAFGLAAASLLQAEVVTADGVLRIANACTNPDLFWGLKGGGGASLGVVTRLTLRVHALPETFGAVNFNIHAASDTAFRRLIAMVIDFYGKQLMNPHWGEQIRFRPDNSVRISMVFQGLDRGQAQAIWDPLLDAIHSASDLDLEFAPLKIVSTPARTFWSPTLFKTLFGFIGTDDRPGAPPGNVFWPGDLHQAGQVVYGYESTWLPAKLLREDTQAALRDALFAASRHWGISLHVNKGLAGAPADVLAAARDTAMNPAVLDAFALAICGAEGPPGYPGIAGHTPDRAAALMQAQRTARAMGVLRQLVPEAGSYLAEGNYFERDWQHAFWGANYARLRAVKQRYDPRGLFFVHHGVGSEDWSDDGFTPKVKG